jgi:hypothetical protein
VFSFKEALRAAGYLISDATTKFEDEQTAKIRSDPGFKEAVEAELRAPRRAILWHYATCSIGKGRERRIWSVDASGAVVVSGADGSSGSGAGRAAAAAAGP